MAFQFRKMTLASLLCLFPSVLFAEVDQKKIDFSGSFENSLRTDYSKRWDPNYYSNHDFQFKSTIRLDQGASALIGIRSLSLDSLGQVTPISYGRASAEASSVRSANVNIDLMAFMWEMMPGATLRLGDNRFIAGSVSSVDHYDSRRLFGTIFKERTLRGIGLKASGFEGAIGLTTTKNDALEAILTYNLPVIENRIQTLYVKPILSIVKNGGRDRPWLVGSEFAYNTHWNQMAIVAKGSGTFLPDPVSENYTQTVLVEPALSYGPFSVGFGLYHAFLADENRSAIEQTEIPVQQFASIEPMMNMWANKIAVSLPVSWNEPTYSRSNDEFVTYKPTLAVFPSAQSAFFVGLGSHVRMGSQNEFFAELKTRITF